MTYNPTKWVDTLKDGEEIIQKGTPVNATNLNKIEDQLVKLTDEVDSKGQPEGFASLGTDGKVPKTEIPQDILDATDSVNNGDFINMSEKGVPDGVATLGSDGIIHSSQLPSNLKEIKVVSNMTERDALEKFEGLRVLVTDATQDPTVNSGWAEYVWSGSEFIKTNEAESIDLVVTWGNVTEKPSTFTPSKHTHNEADIIDLDKYTQEEVNTKLQGKSDVGHKHLWSDITDKPTDFKPSTHKHIWEDITDKPLTFTPSTHSHNYVDLVGIPTEFKPSAHNHDDMYYTESEINGLLNGKSNTDHKHSYNSLTDLPTIPSKTSQLTNDSSYVTSNAGKIHVSYTDTDIPALNVNDIVIKVL